MDKIRLRINQLSDELENEMILIRRDFHKYAETGWTEFRTASKIAAYLENIGVDIKLGKSIFKTQSMMGLPSEDELKKHQERAISQGAPEKYVNMMTGGYTGVVGIIDTKKPGPTVAFRFDIDANDSIEDNSQSHRPCRENFLSVNENAVHACGHDGHGTIGLILAKIVKTMEKELCGKILFIFQPAEEGVRGARSIVDSGILDDTEYLLSGHIGFKADKLGMVVCNTGGFLATTKLDAFFHGVPAHAGASPERGKNALLAASTAALNLHTICQHGDGVGRINVGVLNAGTGRNVVPENALMKIETRGETTEINQYISNRAIEVIKSAAQMYEVDCNIKVAGNAQKGCSDEELSKLVESQAKLVPEVTEIIFEGKLSGSEDVTYMMNKVQSNGGKAAYVLFGTERAADHHNGKFDFDEQVLKIAVKTYAFSLVKLSEEGRI